MKMVSDSSVWVPWWFAGLTCIVVFPLPWVSVVNLISEVIERREVVVISSSPPPAWKAKSGVEKALVPSSIGIIPSFLTMALVVIS